MNLHEPTGYPKTYIQPALLRRLPEGGEEDADDLSFIRHNIASRCLLAVQTGPLASISQKWVW